MNGGAEEYVMGNMGTRTGQRSGTYAYNPNYAGSNYTYTGNEKYITTYAYGSYGTNQIAFNRGKLGDATSEVLLSISGGWYGDYEVFPNSSYPWFMRGGGSVHSYNVGVFYSNMGNGKGYDGYGTRAALVGFW